MTPMKLAPTGILKSLDRNVEPYHREQNQIRIGTKYFF